MATPEEIKAWLNDPASGALVYKRDWAGACQALMYQICKRFGTAPLPLYAEAEDARKASVIVGLDPSKSQPGDFHNFDIGTADHVGLSYGGNLCLMGSRFVDSTVATHCGVMTVEEYCRESGAKYLGFSHTNGHNDVKIEVPPAASNQRTIRHDSRAVVRPEPNRTHPSVGLLPIDSTHTILLWQHGELVDQNGVKTDAWGKLGEGRWIWLGATTDPSTTGIPDGNPPVVVSPPATVADVTKIVGDAKKEILDAIAKLPTAAQIATATADEIYKRGRE